MATNWVSITANLMVEDVNQTLRFYQEVLGFEVVTTAPEQGQFDWAMVRQGKVELMFQSRSSLVKEFPVLAAQRIGGSLAFYITVTDFDRLHEQLRAAGVEIIQDIHTTFYGAREFAALDCNGYILDFAEARERE